MSKHVGASEARSTNRHDVAIAAIKWGTWGAIALIALLTRTAPIIVNLPGVGP